MSLFIGGLAFDSFGQAYEIKLKLGVLAGSIVSALAGSAILVAAAVLRRAPASRAS
jgi:Na+/H+ antiporter NhaA